MAGVGQVLPKRSLAKLGEIGCSWVIFGSVPVRDSRLEALAVPHLGYMEDNNKTHRTHAMSFLKF